MNLISVTAIVLMWVGWFYIVFGHVGLFNIFFLILLNFVF